jgi:hypothetical protein
MTSMLSDQSERVHSALPIEIRRQSVRPNGLVNDVADGGLMVMLPHCSSA